MPDLNLLDFKDEILIQLLTSKKFYFVYFISFRTYIQVHLGSENLILSIEMSLSLQSCPDSEY